jgi:hypothetical protein
MKFLSVLATTASTRPVAEAGKKIKQCVSKEVRA